MKKTILILVMICIAVMSAACSKGEKNVVAEAAPTTVPEKAVEAFGVVEANEIDNISLDIEAKVGKVNVKDGQQVKKGDILMSLDLNAYMEEIRSKEHELSVIRLEAQKIDSKSTNPAVEKLRNDLTYANSQLGKALEEQAKQEKLYQSGSISKSEYDTYVKAVDEKTKTAEDIKYELDSTLRSNDLDSAIQNERAATIESEIRQLKDRINKSYISENNIICDMENGIVYELGYKAGDTISSEVKIISVLNLDSLVVKADVAEEFIKDVKLGAKVEIIPVADKSKAYTGKVTDIAQKATVKNGETIIPVEISIDNRDSFLFPNFNVDVKIFTE